MAESIQQMKPNQARPCCRVFGFQCSAMTIEPGWKSEVQQGQSL